uniref:hypothetical protein n=1 Tax=Algoriphagus sp. TaxID=1872435 RepID=UPI0040484961
PKKKNLSSAHFREKKGQEKQKNQRQLNLFLSEGQLEWCKSSQERVQKLGKERCVSWVSKYNWMISEIKLNKKNLPT